MKFWVKLYRSENRFTTEDGVTHTGVEPFQVEETKKVKDALAGRLLERVRSLDKEETIVVDKTIKEPEQPKETKAAEKPAK